MTYRNSAKLRIYAEEVNQGTLFVYSGTNSTNKTALILDKNGNEMPFSQGAPVDVNISDGIVIAYRTYSEQTGYKLKFSY